MKKRIPFLLILISLFLVNCQKESSDDALSILSRYALRTNVYSSPENSSNDSSDFSVTGLPSKVSVNIPRSIRQSSSGSSSLLENRNIGNRLEPTSPPIDMNNPDAKGYQAVVESITKISALLSDSGFDRILIHHILEKAKQNPGVCLKGNEQQIEITEKMVATIKTSLEGLGLSAEEAAIELKALQDEGKAPKVGDLVPSPAIVYNDISQSNEPQLNDFQHEILYTTGTKVTDVASCPSDISNKNSFEKIMRYNEDFSKVFYSLSSSFNFLGLTVQTNATLTTKTSDTKNDRMVFTMKKSQTESGRTSMTIDKATMEECEKGFDEKKCLKFQIKTEARLPKLDESNVAGKISADMKVKMEGRVDSEGGFLQAKVQTQFEKFFVREHFDNSGSLFGLAFSQDGVNYQSPPGFEIDYKSIDYITKGFSFSDQVYAMISPIAVPTGHVASSTNSIKYIGETDGDSNTYGENDFHYFDMFIITRNGIDPNTVTDPFSVIIGHGEFIDGGIMGRNFPDGIVDKSDLIIEFNGDAKDLATAKLWREVWGWDSTNNKPKVSFVQLTNTLIQDDNPEKIVSDPFYSLTQINAVIKPTQLPNLKANLSCTPGQGQYNFLDFMILIAGSEPTLPENQIGYGSWYDMNDDCNIDIASGEMMLDYYGNAEQLSTVDFLQVIYDFSTDDFSFSPLSNLSLIESSAPYPPPSTTQSNQM